MQVTLIWGCRKNKLDNTLNCLTYNRHIFMELKTVKKYIISQNKYIFHVNRFSFVIHSVMRPPKE